MKKDILVVGLLGLIMLLISGGNIFAQTEPVKSVTGTDVTDAISKGFEWYIYSAAAPKRFKYIGEINYVPAKDGYFYKGVKINDKLYLQNTDGIILEPHSEINFDFNTMVLTAKDYFNALIKKNDNLKVKLDKENAKLKEATNNLNNLKNNLKNLNASAKKNTKNEKNEKKTNNEIKTLKNKISTAEKKKEECQAVVDTANEEYQKSQKKYKDLTAQFNKLSKPVE